jgi:F0F1-type ATP synthase assembly protein I
MSGDPGAGDGQSGRQLTGVGLLGLGMANATCLVLGLVLGHAADRHFGSAPLGVIVGMASGIVLGILGSVFEIRRYLN